MPGPQGLANASFAFAHECDQALPRIAPSLALGFGHGMAEVLGAAKEQVIEPLQLPSLVSIKSSAAEADHVRADDVEGARPDAGQDSAAR